MGRISCEGGWSRVSNRVFMPCGSYSKSTLRKRVTYFSSFTCKISSIMITGWPCSGPSVLIVPVARSLRSTDTNFGSPWVSETRLNRSLPPQKVGGDPGRPPGCGRLKPRNTPLGQGSPSGTSTGESTVGCRKHWGRGVIHPPIEARVGPHSGGGGLRTNPDPTRAPW